ncbi:HD domain-containing protein [Rubripirellula sp.]|nr:HD domain-containing protein [Rubripirellula sp.]
MKIYNSSSNRLTPCALPDAVADLCARLHAPQRLIAHLTLVHDVACQITRRLNSDFPTLKLNASMVQLGAATHDMGKIVHPEELCAAGTQHELAGPAFLTQHGFPADIARCARTHGRWADEELALEELLVALADHVWKGARCERLETRIVELIAEKTGQQTWEVFQAVDELLNTITSNSEARLSWQATAVPSRD